MGKTGKVIKGVAVGAALAGSAYMAYKNKDKISEKKDSVVEKLKGMGAEVTDEVDTNGDGMVDTVAMDTDGDGRPDVVVQDTDHNGKADTAFVDTTGDGIVDTEIDLPEE